ncbi:uncharacterized protein LOC130495814 [Raphanus sativus]|uniref:Uncharacterized protein LOC130495814 n=1 Tax=Raphanus sativus TaxID=3726 RepID=A0A9W3BVP7_RAPSA|nr:uncharacterized protein LOC130495814 [Raphanus sativus]
MWTGSDMVRRFGNGISGWINRMMYSALDNGHPTFTDFPLEKQHMWFQQFAAEENEDHLTLIKTAYTNKKTGEIDDGVVRDVVTLIDSQMEEEVSQLQTEDDDSTGSTGLPRVRINQIVEASVPKKKDRLFGLARRSNSVPSASAPPSFVDQEVLLSQMRDKDARISALESMVASQEAGWEAQRKLNEQMMAMMRSMNPNANVELPTMPDPNVQNP